NAVPLLRNSRRRWLTYGTMAGYSNLMLKPGFSTMNIRTAVIAVSLTLVVPMTSLQAAGGGSSGGSASGSSSAGGSTGASSGASSGSSPSNAGTTLSNGVTVNGTGGSPGANASNAKSQGTTGNNLGPAGTPGSSNTLNNAVQNLGNTTTGVIAPSSNSTVQPGK